MAKLTNIRPAAAKKFLEKHGFELVNIKGSHCVYYKKVGDEEYMPQVITNRKQIHWKNVKVMIQKSGIPEKEWARKCK